MHGAFSIDTFQEKVGFLCPGCSWWHPEPPVMLRSLDACAALVPLHNGNAVFL